MQTIKEINVTDFLNMHVLNVDKLADHLTPWLVETGMSDKYEYKESLYSLAAWFSRPMSGNHLQRTIRFTVANKELHWVPVPDDVTKKGYIPQPIIQIQMGNDPYANISNELLIKALDHYALTQVERFRPGLINPNIPQGIALLDLVKERLSVPNSNPLANSARYNSGVSYYPHQDWQFGMQSPQEHLRTPPAVFNATEETPHAEMITKLTESVQSFYLPKSKERQIVNEITAAFSATGTPLKFTRVTVFMTVMLNPTHPMYEICNKGRSEWGVVFTNVDDSKIAGHVIRTTPFFAFGFKGKESVTKWISGRDTENPENFVPFIVNKYGVEAANRMATQMQKAFIKTEYAFDENATYLFVLSEIMDLPAHYHDILANTTPHYSGWSIWTDAVDIKDRAFVLSVNDV